jgi:hypothetical protein
MKKRTVLWALVACLVLAAVALAGVQQDAISITTKEPVPTRATALGDQFVIPYPMQIASSASACVAVTGSTAQYTLPTTGSRTFRICGSGGLASYAFVNCYGTNPTATTAATTGYNIPPLADGQCYPMFEIPTTTTKCAVIGGASVGGAAAAGGSVCYTQFNNATGMAFGS